MQNPELVAVLKGNKTLRNTNYFQDQDPLCYKGLILIKKLLKNLGYKDGTISGWDDSTIVISTGVLEDFQRLAGIREVNGGLIGQKTLKALVAASKGGKQWKGAAVSVEIMERDVPAPDRAKARQLRRKLQSLKFEHRGFYMKDIPIDKGFVIENAYMMLGFSLGDTDTRVYSNYRFQIFSRASTDKSLAAVYGPATNEKMIMALRAMEQGKDWRSAFQ